MTVPPRSRTLLAWSLLLVRFGCCAAGLVVTLALTRPVTLAVLVEGAVFALIFPLAYVTIPWLWDLAAGRKVREFKGHSDTARSVAFAPDGKYIATASYDQSARLWDVTTGQEVRRFTGHTNGVVDVAFSPDGSQVLTGSFDGTARLWDTSTAHEVRQLKGHSDGVIGVAFSPDGQKILTGSFDDRAPVGRSLRPHAAQLSCPNHPLGGVLA